MDGRMGYSALVLLLFFDLLLVSSTASSKSSGVCISQGGRFPPFSSEGKPPRIVKKGPKDLTLCRVFRKRTCCDAAQTHPALLSIRRLASAGEATEECLHLWELLECSICHPRVGVRPGPPLICVSLCDMVLQACSSAYFSTDAKTQVFIIFRYSRLLRSPAMATRAGFSVHLSKGSYDGTEETFCYGGKASLDSIADSWRTESGVPQKDENVGVIEDFRQWVQEMPFSERVSWAVGGMVLTAGLLFISKRKSHSHRQKQAAILRTARRLEAKFNQQSSIGQGSKKGAGR
ncbi:folate-binding protein 1 isoform X2 [Magnolia sinica]|uniref:folate-binding protein 1 isoform X2 n=1 Tax=Magnolia sinica TaxID=86752 RepID=UPI00265B4A5B|nr:folate-binding protein 1 isoform X2 [Magnolia sinica]